jgi:hypothetical protein
MNPLSQLFGLLLEKIPGFVPPAKAWDTTKQRESLACDLLFRQGLQAHTQSAKREFITRLGASASASASSEKRTVKRPPPAVVCAGLAAAAPKKQTLMDAFMKETSIIGDDRLAKEISAIRRKKKANS